MKFSITGIGIIVRQILSGGRFPAGEATLP